MSSSSSSSCSMRLIAAEIVFRGVSESRLAARVLWAPCLTRGAFGGLVDTGLVMLIGRRGGFRERFTVGKGAGRHEEFSESSPVFVFRGHDLVFDEK
jgi:hypothetical protein